VAFTNTDIASDKLQSNSSPPHRLQHNGLNAAIRQLFTLVWDAREYGAFPDSGLDELAHIQAAIDACTDAGGGTVRLLPGTYLITGVLIISASVVLEGAGRKATTLKRSGGSTSALVRPSTPDGQLDKVEDVGVRKMTIDGNGTAQYGIHVISANAVDLSKLTVQGGSIFQILMDCWDDRPVSGDARDNQGCHLSDIQLIASGTQGGIKLNGNSDDAIAAGDGANTSLNRFDNIWATIVNGDAFYLGNCDNNTLSMLRVYQASGSGRGVVFGSHGAAHGHARHNMLYGVAATGAGVIALNGVEDSGPNTIFGNSLDNGGSSPTIQSGATLYYVNTDGSNNLP